MAPAPALLLALALLAPLAMALGPGSDAVADLQARAHASAARYALPDTGRVADLAQFAWAHDAYLSQLGRATLAPLPAATLVEAVQDAYDAYGWPALTAAQRADMEAQMLLLDHGFAAEAAGLLESLVAHGPIAQEVMGRAIHDGTVDVRPEDAALLQSSALRIAQHADGVAAAMREVRGAPTEGAFLFRDPYDLVLVGDAGPNRYAGNTLGQPFVEPRASLLTIDLGGDDVYADTAGGAYPTSPCYYYVTTYDPLGGAHNQVQFVVPTPDQPDLGLCGYGISASATLDRAGNDTYLDEGTFGAFQHQAVQGAGQFFGVGLLLDMAGDDTYTAVHHESGLSYQAAQGSGGNHGFEGYGFLVDQAGNDHYVAAQTVTPHEGGGNFSQQRVQGGGEGFIADLAGDDTYEAIQTGPSDAYQIAQGSIGDIFEFGGDDVYRAVQSTGPSSVQGAQADSGVLVDAAGDDLYEAYSWCVPACIPFNAWQNVQASAESGGAGELADLAGNDRYVARSNAEQHVQSAGLGAPSLILDLAGDDQYVAEQWDGVQYAQGSGKGSQSILVDAAGNDSYQAIKHGAGQQWAQGGSGSTPLYTQFNGTLYGMLFDLGGADRYDARVDPGAGALVRVQGAGINGLGVLVDCGPGDSYSNPVAGEGRFWRQFNGGYGLDCDGFPGAGWPWPDLPWPGRV